jgi:Kef-type K+ transport system membrane component KefB
MRAAFVLAIVVALATGARSFVGDTAPTSIAGSGSALAFGFLLVAAIQTGHVFHSLKLPHLTGYIVCGVVFGPEVLDLITRPMISDMAVIKKVAVGLIALLAGCELNLRALRARMKSVGLISVLYIAFAAVLLYALFAMALPYIPVTRNMTRPEQLAVALICTNVLCALSPAVVIGVITEERARGPLSDLCLSIVVLADLAIAVTFSMSSTVAQSVFPSLPGADGGLNSLVVHIVGSMLAGLAVGVVLMLYVTRIGSRIGLVIYATLFVSVEVGSTLHLDPLLLGLAAGLFIENISPVSGHEVAHRLRPASMPTFAVFFAVIGAEVHVHAFLGVAGYGVAAAVTRAAGIYMGARLGARLANVEPSVARLVPLGMFPQAGIALALAYLVKDRFQPWGPEVATLLLGTIVVNEMLGPVLFRMALDRAGEIGKKAVADEHHAPHARHTPPPE